MWIQCKARFWGLLNGIHPTPIPQAWSWRPPWTRFWKRPWVRLSLPSPDTLHYVGHHRARAKGLMTWGGQRLAGHSGAAYRWCLFHGAEEPAGKNVGQLNSEEEKARNGLLSPSACQISTFLLIQISIMSSDKFPIWLSFQPFYRLHMGTLWPYVTKWPLIHSQYNIDKSCYIFVSEENKTVTLY